MGPGGFGGMGGPPPMGGAGRSDESLKEPKPKSIKEVPHYLRALFGKFFYRLFYIFRLVWETNPAILFGMLLLALAMGVLPVVQAYVASRLLNVLAASYTMHAFDEYYGEIVKLLICQFASIFGMTLANSINTLITRIAGELVVNHVNNKIMIKAKDIDMKSFDNPEFFAKLENAGSEANRRPVQILNSTFSIVSTLISVVSFITILWAVSPYAPIIMLVISIPSAVISFVFRKKNFLYVRVRSKDRRQLTYYSGLMTNKDLVKEVRMFGLGDEFRRRYQSVFIKYFKGLKSLFIREGSWNIGLAMLTAVLNCLMFLYVAKKVAKGELMIGDYALYTGALNSISGGVASLIATSSAIYEGTLFIDNLLTYLREEKTVKPVSDTPLLVKRHVPHEICFEDVSFHYPGNKREILSHVSFTVNPGETVVLVGLNGAGKTTLIKLLTRLYDPTGGRILLDGRDIKEYNVENLYSVFGIIFQDFGRYAVSVRDNIAFGEVTRPVDEDEIRSAAKESGSADFIEKLPDGYDTPLMKLFEEDGTELSVGQWQKLSVARAFYGDSDILILDEPTASLDAIAEQEIYNEFDELRRDKTTIFVSHRLSSAVTADRILVLSGGSIIEDGTHSELMAAHGEYYRLFFTQAKRYTKE